MLNYKSDKAGSKDQQGEGIKPYVSYVFGTRLKRNKPLKKSQKPLKRTAIKSKIKPIKKVSEKRAREQKIYSAERIKFLTENELCAAKLPGCMIKSSQVHHPRGRGKWYLVITEWVPICDPCHKQITEYSNLAIELGLSERRNTSINRNLST